MSPPRSLRLLMWFGLFGAPGAWAVMHLAGFGLSQAQCDAAGARWDVHMDGWTTALLIATALVAALAEAASIAVYRRTRDAGETPPGSRVHFLAVIGMTIGPLFLTIILMSGLGAVLLPRCAQG